ncbi:hypothetical protein [Methylobacterium sp. E-066]|uniref:hypothetical protein n=1 Tax=Methylobacterium sp. E-066 TaxID=2836584 RepID=UPI001FB8CC60|nr:hypothetical protein [Methylobacterium sp. E-066]MCJ2143877.1 hypothetical protein [Methylobacterium sp. E-066]
MAHHNDAGGQTRIARIVDLTGSGCTEIQARAIAKSVDAAAGEAVEALRHELVRWHIYLAMYLLAEIGIVLLAALVMGAAAPGNAPGCTCLQSHPEPRSSLTSAIPRQLVKGAV